MKKMILCVAALMALSPFASAQSGVPFSLYGGGLLSIPNSPDGFKDSYKNGYHLMLGIGLKTMPMMQLVGKAEYHRFGANYSGMSGLADGGENIALYGVDLRFSPGAPAIPFRPFVFGGGGLASVRYNQFTGSDPLATAVANAGLPTDESKFFYNFGGGLEVKFAPMVSLFAQVRYVNVSTEGQKTSFIPITVGLKIF